jgi:N-acetylmuramoyl-L-alanine amidase
VSLNRIWIPSPNYSSRSESSVRLIVLHTAEGSRNFRDLGAFFASRSSGVSSHVGIDDEKGTIGEYVKRPNKAWTQGNFNSQAVSVEMCAAPINSQYPCGARWSADEWNRHPGMLQNVADWIREESEHFGIPITRLSASQAQGSGHGVCGHVDLGQAGGGHSDPGPNFPWDHVLDLARGGTTTPPDSPEPITEEDMITAVVKQNGAIEVFVEKASTGNVYHTWQGGPNGKWYSTDGKQIDWQAMGNPGK